MGHVPATIYSQSDTVEHCYSFDSMQEDFDNEDPGEVIGAIIANLGYDKSYNNNNYK